MRFRAGTMKSFEKTIGISQGKGLRLILSFLVDYVIVFVLVGAVAALKYAQPIQQHFALQNYSLHYSYIINTRVSAPVLYICCVVAPAVIIALWTMALNAWLESRRAKRERKQTAPYSQGLWEMNAGLLGLFLANAMAYVITGILKNVVGMPRPDLLDRCQPNIAQSQFFSPVYGLSDVSVCNQPDQEILNDGFRSFPSGHSSSSFAGLFYLTLFLAGKIHLFDHKGQVWKVFVVLTPTIGAALIAASHLTDNRHHGFDVLAGSMLGIVCAFIAYRQYFPSLMAVEKVGRAYSVRRHALKGVTTWEGSDAGYSFRQLSRNDSPLKTRFKAEPYGLVSIEEVLPSPQPRPLNLRPPHAPDVANLSVAAPEPLRPCALSQSRNTRDSLGASMDSARALRREYSPTPPMKPASRSPSAQSYLMDVSTSLYRRDSSPSTPSRQAQPSTITNARATMPSRLQRDNSPVPPSPAESRSLYTSTPVSTSTHCRRDRSPSIPQPQARPRANTTQHSPPPLYTPVSFLNDLSHPLGKKTVTDKASLEAIRKAEFPGSPR